MINFVNEHLHKKYPKHIEHLKLSYSKHYCRYLYYNYKIIMVSAWLH